MLYNYYLGGNNDPDIAQGDAWYFPQRHDLFLYDSDGKSIIERNPDLFRYNPDPSNSNYDINYVLPSFNCINAKNRVTPDVPNGGCSGNDCSEGCFQDPPWGGQPFSGCAGSPRIIAITPSHAIGVNHYTLNPGAVVKFYGDQGSYFQYSIVTEKQFIGPAIIVGDNEIVLFTLQSTPENSENPCEGISFPECLNCTECLSEFNTELGDVILAPNVDIKFPRFLPKIEFLDQSLRGIIIERSCFFIDQDFRCGIGMLSSHSAWSWDEWSPLCNNTILPRHNTVENIDEEFWNDLLSSESATIADMVAHIQAEQGVKGDSSSPFFINIPNLTENNGPPILAGILSGGHHLINQVSIITEKIEEYDSENNTNYAEDFSNRIIKRSSLGIALMNYQTELQDKKVGFTEIDLSDMWANKVLVPPDLSDDGRINCTIDKIYKTGLGQMITKNHGFIIDFYFSRILSFNYNESYELSWTEEPWDDSSIFNTPLSDLDQRHCNFTIFNDEVYVCNVRSTIYEDDYPNNNPGVIAKFKINQDRTVIPDGFLFDISDNPEPYIGYSISSNSRELFVGARISISNNYMYPEPAVVVFLRDGNEWVYKQTIDTPNPFDGILESDLFGYTIACDDTWLAVSTKEGLNPDTTKEYVYIYKKNEDGMRELHQTIEQPYYEQPNPYLSHAYGFGEEIEIYNNNIIISGVRYKEGGDGDRFGSTFLYVLNSTNNQFELLKEIKFDYNKEFYDHKKEQSLSLNWLATPPEFSKSIALHEDFLVISAPHATDSRRFSFEDLSEDQEFTPSGVVSLYEINKNGKGIELVANLDKYSGVGQRFGEFVAVSPMSYDEYGREKGLAVLSLEEISSTEYVNPTFSGGKIIIQDFQYNTFPIDKSNSNLRGLGQSFNVKLTETHTKIIQYINTSTSPNGIVAMPLGIHPAYSAIFEKYTKIVSSNNKPIHFLIQEEINDLDTVYLRDVLEKMLANKEGSLYGSNKSDIFNEMSNKELIIGVFNNEDEENTADAQFLTGEFNINIAIINKNEIKINKFLPSNETIGMLSEQIYKYGILSKNPSMASALAVARAHAATAPVGACCRSGMPCSDQTKEYCNSYMDGIYLGDDTTCMHGDACFGFPDITDHETHILFITDLTDDEEKNIRYLRLGVEVYYGMWEHDPNGDGTSGVNEYKITSRSQMQSEDPDLYSIINGFFPEDITIYY